MQKLFSIAWKDTLVRFSSRTELLFFLILPILFTFVLGRGNDGGPSGIRLLATDLDGSGLSAELLTILDDASEVELDLLPQAEAQAEFDDNNAIAMLTILDGFEADVLAGEEAQVDFVFRPNTTNALVLDQSVNNAINQISLPLSIAQSSVSLLEASGVEVGADQFEAAVASASEKLGALEEQVVVSVSAEGDVAPRFDATAHQSAGQLITWVFIPLLGISGIFAYERTNGTLRRFLTTPTKTAMYLGGTILGQLTAGMVQMAILVGFGAIVLGVKWGNDVVGLVLLLVTFGLASVALGTLLGTFVKNDSQASNLSIMFGMIGSLLGGCWFPIELFPDAAVRVANFLPTRWAMQGLIDLSVRGQSAGDILGTIGILLAFAAVFFVAAIARFRYE